MATVQLAGILSPLSRRVLTEAVYRATRAITYRDGAETMISGLAVDAAEDKAAEAALAALRSIENEEQRPIAELSKEQASKHVERLSTVLGERLNEELKLDEEDGSEVLNTLRSVTP